MKARPRRIENRVAEELNKFFAQSKLSDVERIPVLGRSGPDLTWNELTLIVDVKSRLSVPKSYKITERQIVEFNIPDDPSAYGHTIGVRLCDLDLLLEDEEPQRIVKPSITVDRWYYHMDDWTVTNDPDGISALVLHWPRSNVSKATFLMHQDDRSFLNERYHRYK
jgi:hypothetical protein